MQSVWYLAHTLSKLRFILNWVLNFYNFDKNIKKDIS